MQQFIAALGSAATSALGSLPLWAVLVILAVVLIVRYPDRIGSAIPRVIGAWHRAMLEARSAREANRGFRDRAQSERLQRRQRTLQPVHESRALTPDHRGTSEARRSEAG